MRLAEFCDCPRVTIPQRNAALPRPNCPKASLLPIFFAYSILQRVGEGGEGELLSGTGFQTGYPLLRERKKGLKEALNSLVQFPLAFRVAKLS